MATFSLKQQVVLNVNVYINSFVWPLQLPVPAVGRLDDDVAEAADCVQVQQQPLRRLRAPAQLQSWRNRY